MVAGTHLKRTANPRVRHSPTSRRGLFESKCTTVHEVYVLIFPSPPPQGHILLSFYCVEYMRECYISKRNDAGKVLSQNLIKLYEKGDQPLTPPEHTIVVNAVMHSATHHSQRDQACKLNSWIQAARQSRAKENIDFIESSDLQASCSMFSGDVWNAL